MYLSDKEIAMAAEALVAKHPCLKQTGSKTGWNGWKNSIKFKMGNYRGKMRQAGCQEVNAGKISRSNTECLLSHSEVEVKKTEKNLPLIRKMMQTMFALWQQTIVNTCQPVKELMDLWLALKMESELLLYSIVIDPPDPSAPSVRCMQRSNRLRTRSSQTHSMLSLTTILPRLMTLFRQKASKTGKTADVLAEILKSASHEQSDQSLSSSIDSSDSQDTVIIEESSSSKRMRLDDEAKKDRLLKQGLVDQLTLQHPPYLGLPYTLFLRTCDLADTHYTMECRDRRAHGFGVAGRRPLR
ncbi:hypothetical protein QTP70_021783 [Hemibagrus guttatus]|uniref:Uncharacterized protein n=1 Tax=Hemibagrus guttatus TaxID=175788 RepID=A0AAE0UN03_9TELE|nr:hypothetical protein QTP70_021783 [Hemibagrus guttatus]